MKNKRNRNILYLLFILIILLLMMCILPGDRGQIANDEDDTDLSYIIFDDTKNHKIEIEIDPLVLQKLLDEHCTSDLRRDYRVATSFKFDGKEIENIGIRGRGGDFSECNDKRQFKISFNCVDPYISTSYNRHNFPKYENRRFYGLRKLNLRASQNDPTIVRELIAYKMFRENGVPAPRASTAELYINGGYWGQYLIVEQPDKTLLKRWFDDNDGNFYKSAQPGATFLPGSYDSTIYELKTNEILNDTSDIIQFMIDLNNVSTKAELEAIMNIENILNYYAVTVTIGHWDGLGGNCNNDYVYHNPQDNKWYIVVWDCDNTFGSDWGGDTLDSDIYALHRQAGSIYTNDEDHNITNKALLIDEVRNQYKEILCNVITKYDLDITTGFTDEIYRIRDMIKDSVQNDPHMSGYLYDNFIDAFDRKPDNCPDPDSCPPPYCWQFESGIGLKSFIEYRINYIKSQPGICEFAPSIWFNPIEGTIGESFPSADDADATYDADYNTLDGSVSTMCVIANSDESGPPDAIEWTKGPDIFYYNGDNVDASNYRWLIFYAKVVPSTSGIVINIKHKSGISRVWLEYVCEQGGGVGDEWQKVCVDLDHNDTNPYETWHYGNNPYDFLPIDKSEIQAIMPATFWDYKSVYIDDIYLAENTDDPIPIP